LPAGFQIRIFADRIVKVEAINLPRSYVPRLRGGRLKAKMPTALLKQKTYADTP
jgi:hypothetical protein